jgi:hypothetical protein
MYVERIPDDVQPIYDAYRATWRDKVWESDIERARSLMDEWSRIQRERGLHWGCSYSGFAKWYRPVMAQLGMTFDPKFDVNAAWLNPSPEAHEIMMNDDEPEDHPLVAEYYKELDRAVLARRFEHPGIPIYKISTGSDGFLVHPDEILSALKEYEQRGGRSAARRMWERIDPASIETEIVWWDRWVAFMQIAAQLDGFRVR